MKVYMDVCCLNRLFDDQSQDKVRLETEAIVSVLKRCSTDADWKLIGSNIIKLEISKNPDPVKKKKVQLLQEGITEKVDYNTVIRERAKGFRLHNVKLFDSLHMAAAEYAEVDVFLTTDNQLIRAAARTDIRIRVVNPLTYYLEVLNNDQLSN
jgi:hypothetical protein